MSVNNLKFLRYVALFCALLMLTACPYPVYKTLQPSAKIVVVDAEQQPVASANVVLITRVHPTPDRLYDAKLTNAQGVAQFLAKREVQVETTFLHGALEYQWRWCIEKQGYQTVNLSHVDTDIVVTMAEGESKPCEVQQQ